MSRQPRQMQKNINTLVFVLFCLSVVFAAENVTELLIQYEKCGDPKTGPSFLRSLVSGAFKKPNNGTQYFAFHWFDRPDMLPINRAEMAYNPIKYKPSAMFYMLAIPMERSQFLQMSHEQRQELYNRNLPSRNRRTWWYYASAGGMPLFGPERSEWNISISFIDAAPQGQVFTLMAEYYGSLNEEIYYQIGLVAGDNGFLCWFPYAGYAVLGSIGLCCCGCIASLLVCVLVRCLKKPKKSGIELKQHENTPYAKF